jgi:hypothetical protein
MPKRIDKNKLNEWLYRQLEVSPSMLQQKFRLGLGDANQLFQKLIADGYLNILTEKSGRYLANSLRVMEDKKGKPENDLALTIKELMNGISAAHERASPIRNYIVPLQERLRSSRRSHELIQVQPPLYAFIDCACDNEKTLFISSYLEQSSFLLLLIEALSGVSRHKVVTADLTDSDWPLIIGAASMVCTWPGEFRSVIGLSFQEQLKYSEKYLTSDFEVIIFDFDELEESPTKKKDSQALNALLKLATARKKKIVLPLRSARMTAQKQRSSSAREGTPRP